VKKQVIKALSLLMVVMLLAGCGGQSASSGGSAGTPAAGGGTAPTEGTAASVTVEDDTLIVALDAEGATFDPFNFADLDSGFLVRAVHEPLAYLDSTNPDGFTPVLAESWEYLDNQTIRLHLRKGVKFQKWRRNESQRCRFFH